MGIWIPMSGISLPRSGTWIPMNSNCIHSGPIRDRQEPLREGIGHLRDREEQLRGATGHLASKVSSCGGVQTICGERASTCGTVSGSCGREFGLAEANSHLRGTEFHPCGDEGKRVAPILSGSLGTRELPAHLCGVLVGVQARQEMNDLAR
jgi:hypothetical protein